MACLLHPSGCAKAANVTTSDEASCHVTTSDELGMWMQLGVWAAGSACTGTQRLPRWLPVLCGPTRCVARSVAMPVCASLRMYGSQGCDADSVCDTVKDCMIMVRLMQQRSSHNDAHACMQVHSVIVDVAE